MKKGQMIAKHINRTGFVLLHAGMLLVGTGYAVMLYVDAVDWKGYFSIFKALFSTYNPFIYRILIGPGVMAGWAFISLGGVAFVFTAVFILKKEFKSNLHQMTQAVFVFTPVIVIAFIMFFRQNRTAIQTASILGWAAVCSAYALQLRFLPKKLKGASELCVNIVMFITIFLTVNVYAHRHDVIFDVSAARFYSLSSTTKKLLKSLDKKVKVYAILYSLPARKNMIYDYTKKLFSQITNTSDNINVEFVPPFSQKAESIRRKYNITEHHEALVFECGEKTKAVPIEETGVPLAVLKEDNRENRFMDRGVPEIEAYKGENIFYLTVNEITSEKKKQILFVEGHGERSISEYSPASISEFSNELKNLNYVVLTTTLRQGELPVCDTLVISAPRTSFLDWELELIRRFLKEKNGSLIYLCEPVFKDRSVYEAGLAGIMADYGIHIRNDYVILYAKKLKTHLPEVSTDTYGYHAITKSFKNEQVYLTSARSLDEGICKEPRMSNTSLFSVAPGVDYSIWGETRMGFKTRSLQFDRNDNPSPFDLAVLAGPRDSYTTPRIIVIGDVDIATNRLLAKGNNKRFLLNCINWTLKQKEVDIIEPRKYEYIKIDVSDELMGNIGYLVVVCLPGFIMLYGILVLIRRRS